jgi:hypothetical protein
MRLSETFLGDDAVFEGDSTLYLRSLREGARVTKATLTLAPAAPAVGTLFTEPISFHDQTGTGAWGAMRDPAGLDKATYWAIADLHTRRVITAVVASHVASTGNTALPADGRVSVQMSVGGTWMGVATDGTILVPDKKPLILRLPTESDQAEARPVEISLPMLVSDKIKLTAVSDDEGTVGDDGQVRLYGVRISSAPTNVSVRLGQMSPFWTRPGALTSIDGETSPDFATVLNAFLAETPPENGFYTIPIVIHSDAIARINVGVVIEYVITTQALPPYLAAATLSYDFSTLPGPGSLAFEIKIPPQAKPTPSQAYVQLRGQFDSSRIAQGHIGEDPASFPVAVFPERSVAQPFCPSEDIDISAIDLKLEGQARSLVKLNVAIQSDADGKPSGEVLANTDVQVKAPLPGVSPWLSAPLSTPLRISTNQAKRYWIVLQSLSGHANWHAVPVSNAEPMQHSQDGGLSWRVATAVGASSLLSGLFRLRHIPQNYSIPVRLRIGSTRHAIELSRYAPLGRVDFTLDFSESFTQHLREVQSKSTVGRNLLVNGALSQPPPDDATRRLFGVEAWQDPGELTLRTGILGRTDLASERFVTLSADGKPVRMDLAGRDPVHTTLAELKVAIEQATSGMIGFATGTRSISGITLYRWSRPQVPTAWQGVPGQVIRTVLEQQPIVLLTALPDLLEPILVTDEDIATAQAAAGPAHFSQHITVEGGHRYRLAFAYDCIANGTPQDPALWHLSWLDKDGNAIAAENGLLFARHAPEYELVVTAPESAVEAKLKFEEPGDQVLALQDISFAPTTELLSCPCFCSWQVMSAENGNEVDVPRGWEVSSGWVERRSDGLLLKEDATEDVVLIQRVGVVTGREYSLRIHASVQPPRSPSVSKQSPEQCARVELRWLGATSQDPPIILALGEHSLGKRGWTGKAPEAAEQAEVRLVRPQNCGDWLVKEIHFVESDLFTIPMVFEAEAPGELTVSNLSVAYDLPEPAGASKIADRAVSKVSSILLRPEGFCDAGSIIEEPPVLSPGAETPSGTPPSLTDITGIGPRRAELLAQAGISSIADLAAAIPEEVRSNLRNISLATATRIVEEARNIHEAL